MASLLPRKAIFAMLSYSGTPSKIAEAFLFGNLLCPLFTSGSFQFTRMDRPIARQDHFRLSDVSPSAFRITPAVVFLENAVNNISGVLHRPVDHIQFDAADEVLRNLKQPVDFAQMERNHFYEPLLGRGGQHDIAFFPKL